LNNEIVYIGEHLIPGYLGQFCVVLSFVAALFAVWSYRKATKTGLTSWNNLGRAGYIIHGLSTLTLIATLFYIMVNHYYEYAYVQQHVSEDLPMRYIFSAFWEGQEGSFLLWMFWHIILGFILMRKAGEWENSVMIFLALIQVILASMLLGIHINIGDFSYKLGSNPAMLLRDVFAAPIFQQADYVASISGTGLNALLQNYWMTIHPPTLFLGFASTTIPFAFAAAGLYTGKNQEWLRPAMKWSLFSAGMLGLGILMGSAWAYEALTFGGYWAWDPVENMSLVPWIFLIAGVHTNLIALATGRAIRSTFIYYALCFVGILYSTYLTRSGILGDTSAHAFTEMGLEPQLIFMVLFFSLLSVLLYVSKTKTIPVFKKEESIYSREFWMFVGALVLLFSGAIIAASTSLPVMNAIIALRDPEFVGTVISDPIPHYNKFQVWIAILVTVLSAKSVFLRYKSGAWSGKKKLDFAMKQGLYALLAGGLTFLLSFWIDYYHWKYLLLAFAACYTIVSNGAYMISIIKHSPRLASAACSHMGFAIMIIGILTSGLNQDVLTTNPFVMKGIIKDKDMASAVTLIKNEPLYVNNHWITYESDTVEHKTRTFKIKIEREDSLLGNVDPYYVYPNVLFSNDFTKVAATNPDAKHFLSKDIFTSVASLPKSQMDVKFAKEEEDSLKYVKYELDVGDTLFTREHYGVIEAVTMDPTNEDYLQHDNDLGIGAQIRFRSLDGTFDEVVEPAVGVRENLLYQYHAQINELRVKLKLNEQTFDNYFSTEDGLTYTNFEVTRGESFQYNGLGYTLKGFEQTVTNKNYQEQANDLTIQAIIVDEQGHTLKPVYVIRNAKPFNLKAYVPETGVHARMININPTEELFSFSFATDDRSDKTVVIEIAEDVTRSDVIVLEALIFPGINLFWLGSLMMLAGFFFSLWSRRKQKHLERDHV